MEEFSQYWRKYLDDLRVLASGKGDWGLGRRVLEWIFFCHHLTNCFFFLFFFFLLLLLRKLMYMCYCDMLVFYRIID